MRSVKPLEKNIENRCNIVILSPEAASHPDKKTLAQNILSEMQERKEGSVSISRVKKEITSSKKQVKAHMINLINLTVEGNRMLESVKSPSETVNSSLRIKTKLEKMNESSFLEECKATCDNLLTHKQQLLQHGYTEAQVNELSDELTLTNSILKSISETNLTYSEIHTQQKISDNSIFEKLEKLSRAIEVNKMLMPNLFRDYFAIKLSTSKKHPYGIKGNVTCNGQPLANASLKIYATVEPVRRKKTSVKLAAAAPAKVEKVVYDKLTKDDGAVNIRTLKPGTYRMVIAKNGFEPQEVTVYINPKEFTGVNIEMAKL